MDEQWKQKKSVFLYTDFCKFLTLCDVIHAMLKVVAKVWPCEDRKERYSFEKTKLESALNISAETTNKAQSSRLEQPSGSTG